MSEISSFASSLCEWLFTFRCEGERNDRPAEIHERREREGSERGRRGEGGEKIIIISESSLCGNKEGVFLLVDWWSMKLVQHQPPTGSKSVEWVARVEGG